ncbi:hypothetical protein IF2G_08605 [Cordyceps javanica]|nr:hypothetical protein IF2G_08605 [Cordyceps javanica]
MQPTALAHPCATPSLAEGQWHRAARVVCRCTSTGIQKSSSSKKYICRHGHTHRYQPFCKTIPTTDSKALSPLGSFSAQGCPPPRAHERGEGGVGLARSPVTKGLLLSRRNVSAQRLSVFLFPSLRMPVAFDQTSTHLEAFPGSSRIYRQFGEAKRKKLFSVPNYKEWPPPLLVSPLVGAGSWRGCFKSWL